VRIAQVAPLSLPIPPRLYGGTERVVHAISNELAERGHEVVLFAAGESDAPGELVPICPKPLWEMTPLDPFIYQVVQVEEVVRRSAEFDIIHSHIDYLPWLAGSRLQAPMVTTLHGRLDLPEHKILFQAFTDQPLISISHAQRKPVAHIGLNWVSTVYHGFRLNELYRMGRGDGGYLVFLGRIYHGKGPQEAIRVAMRTGMPIKIAARVDPVEDQEFFETEVKPLLAHPQVEWLGQLDDTAKAELLAGAAGVLLPLTWDEPFGLVVIEALASGTPVISRPRGSLPELVEHGKHGFLVWTEDEMVEAVGRLGEIDRQACRQHALERFGVEQMVDGYEQAYRLVAAVPSARDWAEPEEPAALPYW
jgi:glycosyltransferase involved in cell wall biosynthesis